LGNYQLLITNYQQLPITIGLMQMTWKRPSQLPLQYRLTLWYLLTLGLILLLFAAFLYFQMRANLLNQLDASLQLVASQMRISEENDRLIFQTGGIRSEGTAVANEEFVIYLITSDGALWDKAGRQTSAPLFWPPPLATTTLLSGDDHWRVYSQEIQVGTITGWLQVVGDMEGIYDTLDGLLTLIFVGGPLALVLAGLGGIFMAGRALQPIDRMTRTAQTITANDLNQRIEYEGPADEVGRLAQTFDTMLDRLQTAFERERQFTGDAAHELRTPLAALKGRIGVTLSQSRQPQAYVDTLQEMEGQVDRLIRLSNDLLFMARLDQGQMTRQMERIDVGDFMGAVVDQIRPLAQTKSITLEEALPVGLTIEGDMDLLIRLFLNLLDNAVKYTPENGRVSITASQSDNTVKISVTDTGPGIPSEHLPHVFERFYRTEGDRARGTRNNHQGGAGLGLAIAYEIARTHGGDLKVVSQLGKGTTFTTLLPKQLTS
jgi:heavy metal sensor kinase